MLLLGLWQAAALILLVIVLRRYAQLVLGNDGRARAISLTLALFLVSPFFLFVVNLHFKIKGQWTLLLSGESYAVQWISGYFPIALTVTAMIGYLIALERLMGTLDRPTLGAELLQRAGFAAAALGATAAFLHPWQGTELAVLTVGAGDLGPAAITAQRPAAAATGGDCFAAALLPDPAEDRRRLGDGQPGVRPAPGSAFRLLGWLTTFGPVVLASIPGWRTRATSDRQRLLRLWPIAVLITFVAVPTGKFEAFAGVSVPLALLAVQGWRRVLEERRLGGRNPRVLRFLVTAGVVVLVFGAAPATTWLLIKRADCRPGRCRARPPGRRRARLPRGRAPRRCAEHREGRDLGTGPDRRQHLRRGHSSGARSGRRGSYVRRLFDYPGKRPLSPTAALALIEQPGARYVLEPCGARENLWPLLERARLQPARIRLRDRLLAPPIQARTLSVQPSSQ